MLTRRQEPALPSTASMVDGAYRALKEAIRQNAFPPGYQAAEAEIAKQLGMSRTPVHEAMIRLQEEGLVEVLSRRGIMIRAISPEDMKEIYDVTIALEGAAAALIASQAPDEVERNADTLERATAEMETALLADDLVAWAEADERFHLALIQQCGNRRLARMAGTVMDQSHRARMFTLHLRPKPTTSAVEHRAIIDAIRRGEATEADTCARAHRRHARDKILPLLVRHNMRNL